MVTGTAVLPEEVSHAAAGSVPSDPDQRGAWAPEAVSRVVRAYRLRGYVLARAWYRLQPDGSVWIHLDEGRMRLHFSGAGSVSAFLFQVDFNLPQNVFHRPTLTRALQELKRKHGLLNAYFRINEPGETMITPFGDAVPQRVLQIYIVRKEKLGWGFDISLNSTWGVLPGVTFAQKGLLWSDDRFQAKMEIAFPYRRYLLNEDPKIGWVHGGVWCSYRLPRLLGKHVGLRPDTALRVSRYERLDLGAASYYATRETTVGNLIVFLPSLEMGIGGGFYAVWIFNVERTASTVDSPVQENAGAVRPLARLFLRFDPSSRVLRRDQRSYVHFRLDASFGRDSTWMIDLGVRGQLFHLFGRHRLVLRARGVLLAGDEVPFYDEVQLAGDYQRVFFANRYWVREAAQLETAYRVNLWRDWFEVGLFHDLSVFTDRTDPANPPGVANAFGPSLHFLLFDLFTLGIYQGFGFSPLGFDHTFSFNMQTIF